MLLEELKKSISSEQFNAFFQKTSLISIDKSICLGETDYEIECESKDLKKATKDIIKFLKKFGIEYKKFSSSKLRRAMERYQKAK